VDANGNVLIAQLPGDIITIDSTISEEFQGDYEIMNLKYSRPAADGAMQQTAARTRAATPRRSRSRCCNIFPAHSPR
jgi:hypothetical protein